MDEKDTFNMNRLKKNLTIIKVTEKTQKTKTQTHQERKKTKATKPHRKIER